MTYDPDKHHRRSIRLQDYDYGQEGAYFVTVCVQGRACLLGEVVGDAMQLNDVGRIVAESWLWLAERYPYVVLDAWVIMPNHVHGIIVITDTPIETAAALADDGVGAAREPPENRVSSPDLDESRARHDDIVQALRDDIVRALREAPLQSVKRKPLGQLIGAFKTTSTKKINILRKTTVAKLWQRNFWERVIRDERELNARREYIIYNPGQWAVDKYYNSG